MFTTCPYCDSRVVWVEGDLSYNCTGCPEFWCKEEVSVILVNNRSNKSAYAFNTHNFEGKAF